MRLWTRRADHIVGGGAWVDYMGHWDTLMLAPFAKFSDLPADVGTWGTLVALGVVHTGLVYILLYGAIQKLPTHLTGSLSFIYPIVAILVDYLAFGHRLHPAQLIGAAAILIAAAGMNLGWSLRNRKLMPGIDRPMPD